jgi:MOSC domain-containing protein YiiM
MSGRLIGIARKHERRAPVETLDRGRITVEGGLAGDHRGPKYPKRRITVIAREAWEAALAELPADAAGLPWTARRANLLVEGVCLPRAVGGVVQIGPVVLEITGETNPCERMEEAWPGLLEALTPEWRGGVTCSVVEGGEIALGDAVDVLIAPVERTRVLPG